MEKYKTFLIKNMVKFNDIKLKPARVLSLDQATGRRGKTGVSSKTFGQKWFLLPEGKALFKTFDSLYAPNLANVRMLNEVICYKLAQQVGMRCAQYIPAQLEHGDKQYIGLATINILKPNETSVSYRDFRAFDSSSYSLNMVDFAQLIDIYAQNGTNIKKKALLVDMYKKILFDAITLQTDRNSNNYCLIRNKKTNTYRACPLFDNEFAFACDLLNFFDYNGLVDFREISAKHSIASKIFTVEYQFASTNRYANLIKDICFYAKKYPQLHLAFKVFMNNINIEKVFDELTAEGYQINEDYKEYVCEIVNQSKHLLAEAFKVKVPAHALEEIERIF